tara:strand:- start:184 stop:447 length:264 start_codon:yes stop_codon:yes gene_type:complete
MKTELRKEYEAMFGVVDGTLRLYDDKGNMIYCEYSKGLWTKYEYDDNNNVVYAESSREGVIFDNRTCSDKVFIDEQTGKKFKMTEVK